MKFKFKSISLRSKILLGYMITLFLLLITTVVFYRQNIHDSINSNIEYMSRLNTQFNSTVDLLFQPFEKIEFIHYSDNELRNILYKKAEETNYTKQHENDLYVKNALNHILIMNRFAIQGGIITANNDVYSSVTVDKEKYIEYVTALMEQNDWSDSSVYYSEVHEGIVSQTRYPLLTVMNKMYYYGKYVGTVAVDINYDELMRSFSAACGSSTQSELMVIRENGILFNSGENRYPKIGETFSEQEVDALYAEIMQWENAGQTIGQMDIRDVPCFVSVMQNKQTGWYILQYAPVKHVLQASTIGMQGTLVAFIAIFTLAAALAVFVSRQITRPVKHIIAAMQSTTEGKVEPIADPGGKMSAEIHSILVNYNHMVSRINESIETTYVYALKNKQMELRMLRYQINPHFMYNTLNTISALAEIEGVENIVQMTNCLSKILQYNVRGGDEVFVQDEVEYVRNYLKIQDMRFPGRFQIKVCIQPEAKRCRMLKFLIQPILENAVSHGLEHKRTDARIDVDAFIKDEDLLISVYDNGIGMNAETLRRWNEHLAKPEDNEAQDGSDENGIGLENVNSRIKNYYGSAYGVSIFSEENVFTQVVIRVQAKWTGGAAQ
ncbi:MAG: histidine kinase [Eubacteriales bacterium]|nr:histidine kinase [Eubacteriales bacterium]